MDGTPYVDAFHSNANSTATVDPNTGLAAGAGEVNPAVNKTMTGQDNAYLDAWAENPTGNPPVRTWTDPTARPAALPNSTQVQQFLRDHQGMGDAEIAQNMQRYGVSPEAFAEATGMDAGQVAQRYQAATGAAWNPKFSDNYLAAWHDASTEGAGSPAANASGVFVNAPAPAPASVASPAPAPVINTPVATPAPTPAPDKTFQDYFDAGPGEGGGGPGDSSGVGSAGSAAAGVGGAPGDGVGVGDGSTI